MRCACGAEDTGFRSLEFRPQERRPRELPHPPLTLSHDVPFLLDHGQRVATLEYEPMAERPDRLYGEGLRSNYQGQGLRLSKHFA